MRLSGKPALQERLAAEYALGTLRGRARSRFERAMREDAALARAAAEWQTRLAPLGGAVPAAQPPARVWRAIAARLPAPRSGLWASLAFWRGLGLAASGAAAVLVAALATLQPPAPVPAPAPIVLKVPTTEMAEVYLAVLQDPKTQKPLLLASVNQRSDQLQVRTLDPSIRVSGKDLQLWALPAGGKAPRSLGVVGAGERATVRLAAHAQESLADVPMLALSLEPQGGSPTGAPTGPVLAAGPCVKFW